VVQDDEYILSFGQLAGYKIHREYQYTHWMPPYQGKILVLQRNDAETTMPGILTEQPQNTHEAADCGCVVLTAGSPAGEIVFHSPSWRVFFTRITLCEFVKFVSNPFNRL